MWTCMPYTPSYCTCKDVMNDKLKFCSEKISCLQRVKRLPSLMQQSQFTCYPLIDLDKRLEHKLVWLCKTGDWLATICERRISNAGSLWARVRQTVVFLKYLSNAINVLICIRVILLAKELWFSVKQMFCKSQEFVKSAKFTAFKKEHPLVRICHFKLFS